MPSEFEILRALRRVADENRRNSFLLDPVVRAVKRVLPDISSGDIKRALLACCTTTPSPIGDVVIGWALRASHK